MKNLESRDAHLVMFLAISLGKPRRSLKWKNIIHTKTCDIFISPDESRGYIGFRSVAPPPPP